MEDLKNIIESLLFMAEEPLSVDRLVRILNLAESKDIRSSLQTLMNEYSERNGSFTLKEIAGGLQFRTRPEYTQWIKRLVEPKPVRLSKAALETLAIIAYKQPIIRSDIEHIRGVDCGGVVRALQERKMIRVLGRKEIAGRPLIYATTKRFLEVFDLKNLKDLPTPKEIEDFGKSTGVELIEQEAPEDPLESADVENNLAGSEGSAVENASAKSEPEMEEISAAINADDIDLEPEEPPAEDIAPAETAVEVELEPQEVAADLTFANTASEQENPAAPDMEQPPLGEDEDKEDPST